jgi:hypothetical protein
MQSEKREHWEKVYTTKTPDQVSWTQENPKTSLDYIKACKLPKDTEIIDIGGGDSLLVDFLLQENYSNISVLDISQHAIDRAKKRLGSLANSVTWIVSDIIDFKPNKKYAVWHDRAAFHFLTDEVEIDTYKDLVRQSAMSNLIIGTFSKEGPLKCSGLNISQYNSQDLSNCFGTTFELVHAKTEDHTTPFDTHQNFQFVHLKKK